MSGELVPTNPGEFLFYQTDDGRTRIEVRFEGDTVWLSQKIMAELFQKDVRTISEHIRNIFDEGELQEGAVIRNFRITAADCKQWGTPHFGLTAEKLFEPHESLPWNPLIARVFHRRGIIESWGRGTLKMAELTEKAGLPRPEIEEQAGCVVVRFRPSRYVPPRQVKQNLTERQQAILQLLADHSSVSRKLIVQALQEPELSIRDDLERLRNLGLVATSGHGRGAVWSLTNS
jgi:hypothetical protein